MDGRKITGEGWLQQQKVMDVLDLPTEKCPPAVELPRNMSMASLMINKSIKFIKILIQLANFMQ